MNGLEALEIVKYECGFADDRVRESLPIIKKELKDGEKHKKAFEVVRDFVKDMKKCVDIVFPPENTKYTTVLVSCDAFEYNYECKSQEEFDLLKEVMK